MTNYLCFVWCGSHLRSARSMEWFLEWMESGYPTVRQHVLDIWATRVPRERITAVTVTSEAGKRGVRFA